MEKLPGNIVTQETKKPLISRETRELIKRGVLACIFVANMSATEAQKVFAQGTQAKIENLNQKEKNPGELRSSEHLIPNEVMQIFNEVYISIPPGDQTRTTLGYYIDEKSERDFQKKKMEFEKRIEELNLAPDVLTKLEEMFRVGNIIFGENAINDPDFEKKLWHERVHKFMNENLSAEEKMLMARTRIFLLADYKATPGSLRVLKPDKLEEYNKANDELLSLAGEIKQEDYDRMQKEIFERFFEIKESLLPVVETENKSPVQEFKIYSMFDSKKDEFWSTLAEGDFPSIEKYIKRNYPSAYAVFEKIKNSVKENKE